MLETLARHGGQDPLSSVVVQHADMVYATCHRVLGNEADAADVAQETFFHFCKSAGRIRGSIGAWLHQVATNRSIDLVRQNSSRRRREETYATEGFSEANTWHEVEPLVDEALAALPAEARELLVEHYLERRTMAQIGQRRGLSQPTVSRRVAAALEELRGLLRRQGVQVGSTVLGALLGEAAQAAPASLLQGLGKMVLAHVASGGSTAAAAGGIGLAAGATKAGLVAVGLLLVGIGFLTFKPRPAPAPTLIATNLPPASVSFGFATSVVRFTGPGGATRVYTSGTNFVVTNSTVR
jgi:RNA polymerase sigma factor (sigma-70 family)